MTPPPAPRAAAAAGAASMRYTLHDLVDVAASVGRVPAVFRTKGTGGLPREQVARLACHEMQRVFARRAYKVSNLRQLNP